MLTLAGGVLFVSQVEKAGWWEDEVGRGWWAGSALKGNGPEAVI